MVRLVFRPYTQIRRTICTSVSLRASTRVSPGFTLFRHRSPSFGSQQICSYSHISAEMVGRCREPTHITSTFTFIAHQGLSHPNTRIYVRLLGPCFKTGRMKTISSESPTRQMGRPPSASQRRDGTLFPNDADHAATTAPTA